MNHMRRGWQYSSMFSLLPKQAPPAMRMSPACLSTVAKKMAMCQPLSQPPNKAPVLMRAREYHDGAAIEAATARTHRLLAAKAASGKSFDQIADEVGLTNTYTAQLLLGQAKLSAATALKLKASLPDISDEDIKAMVETFPMRRFDPVILQEPNVYRTYEAVTHYGEAIKCLINEQCGDGIMSAIDFYCDVGTVKGKHGETRVVVTFNGKFLPHIEQVAKDNGAPSPRATRKD